MDHRVDLDIVGALEDADKSSCVRLSWDYLRHYEAILEPFRHLPINIVEIGVAGGPSMRIWKWFFSQANITGIDIDPHCVKQAQERVKIEIGSQVDAAFLDRVCAENPPTVIVDDGSHMMEHMIFSFEHLFPKLLPGGVYIIEDFGGFLGIDGAEKQTDGRQNAPEYFLEVARRCFSTMTAKAGQKVPPAVAALVDSITFIGSAVMMRKRDPVRDVERALATAEAYLKDRKSSPSARENLAAYVVRHNGAPDMADTMLQTAIETEGGSMFRLMLRAENALNAGRKDEASEFLKQAVSYPRQGHFVMAQMAKLQEAVGDIAGAVKSAEAALEGRPNKRPYRQLLRSLQANM